MYIYIYIYIYTYINCILNQSISKIPSHLNIDWSSEYSDSRDKRATTAGLFRGTNPYRIGTNIHVYKYRRTKSFIYVTRFSFNNAHVCNTHVYISS
jgi:hypothetical protein